MVRVAKFEKVSKERFVADFIDTFPEYNESTALEVYENIKLPTRATSKSAGYDIFMPITYTLEPGKTVKIPTGIRVKMNDDYVLMVYPRSGLGFKYRLQLNNTVGVIDADYYDSDNEGHIFVKITNDTNENKTVTMEANTGFAQGIFMQYAITVDDDVTTVRNGGLGSTTK
ncbi:MAG: deoxyuridine 5'-triphosphate nucleotidohydrolase [Lachnospiraceae bacterium]|nr:deoxyuridine 5'-triphosphate nucleotidohydrolase [Lachnospiraceae bacterium]